MVWMKRRKMGRAWGTMEDWHTPVLRIVAKMWRMLAYRSVRMMLGNTSDASTRASRDSRIRGMASSGICWRTVEVDSLRFGMAEAKTSTMTLVSSNSCSISSER